MWLKAFWYYTDQFAETNRRDMNLFIIMYSEWEKQAYLFNFLVGHMDTETLLKSDSHTALHSVPMLHQHDSILTVWDSHQNVWRLNIHCDNNLDVDMAE